MNKLRIVLFAVVGVLFTAMTAFAQGVGESGVADNASSVNKYRALAAGIGFAIAVFGGAVGQSRIGAAACEGAARNPGGASGRGREAIASESGSSTPDRDGGRS